MGEIPFIAFGSDELGAPIKKGDKVKCRKLKCRKSHTIELATNSKTGIESDILMFYRCGSKTYLAGIKGQAIP